MAQKENLDTNQKMFNQISEAYEVLSNSDLKQVYDKLGNDGLLNYVKPSGKKVTGAGYSYSGKCYEIFEAFFGTKSPFVDRFDLQKVPSKVNDPNDPDSPKDIDVVLGCTIYEFYNGSLKHFNYMRNVLLPDGQTVTQQEETLTVEVKPGFDCDTVIHFASKGHEAFAYHQSGLNVKFSLLQDDNAENILPYVRNGDDLVYTHKMSLEDALLSRPIQIRTLDGRNINLSLDQTITPQTVHTIRGEGMPRKANNKEKGDLNIKFNIIFPQVLKVENKNAIINILEQVEA